MESKKISASGVDDYIILRNNPTSFTVWIGNLGFHISLLCTKAATKLQMLQNNAIRAIVGSRKYDTKIIQS